jgi:hypothetical protein
MCLWLVLLLLCCCPAVAFDDQKKCAEGFDTIAEGTFNATKTRESHTFMLYLNLHTCQPSCTAAFVPPT